MKIEKILAHHAGARLYKHATSRYPSPEELARFVQGELDGIVIHGGMAAYSSTGDLKIAEIVMKEIKQHNQHLGEVYQNLRDIEEKKELGQVFTPAEAVEATLDLIGDFRAKTIIDPACGAGDFLLAAAKRWPQAKIIGVDIDPIALAVAQTRLTLETRGEVELILGNALTVSIPQGYDLVVGNPPWGSKLSAQEVLGYNFSRKKPLNSYVYFLELAARLLKPGGRFAFVLPEAFIKVWAYQGVRKWLLQNFGISGMHYIPNLFKEYYAPAILISAFRLPCKGPDAIPVWYQPGLKVAKVKYNTLPNLTLGWERFNINWRKEMEELWEHCCTNAVRLIEGSMGGKLPEREAIVDFSLGIVTGDNKRFVKNEPFPGYLPLLVARDISPFCLAQPSHWLRYDSSKLQQVAAQEKYQVPGKIVYRFIAREIIAAVDNSAYLTINNVNIIVPLRLPFELEYLVALLNSKLLNTLYMYKFYTGKVLTRHLKQLPLRVGSLKGQEEISAMAKDLATGTGDKDRLDNAIFDLYGLDPIQRRLIDKQYRELKETFFV